MLGMGLGGLNSEGRVFSTERPAQGLACWPGDVGIVFVSHGGFSAQLDSLVHVVCLRFKETLTWGGGALPLGPLLLSDPREEGREGPGTWGDRPRLLLPGCPAVF